MTAPRSGRCGCQPREHEPIPCRSAGRWNIGTLRIAPRFSPGGGLSGRLCAAGRMDGLATAANTISLIIPCWNDAAALRECLRAVGQLRGVDEVIVADASSQDDSLAVAQAAGVQIIRCEQPNRGRQLNAGSSAAKGDLLVFQHV